MLQEIFLPSLLHQVRVLAECFQAALLDYLIPRWDLLLFGAEGPSVVTLDVVPPRGMLSTGSGEGCCLLGLGDCLGTGAGGTAGADCSSAGEVLCDKVSGWDVGACTNKTWQEATSMSLSSTGLACKAVWQVERKSVWLVPSSLMTCSSKS